MSNPPRIDRLQQKIILFKVNISRQQRSSLKLIKACESNDPTATALLADYDRQLTSDRQQYRSLEEEKAHLAGVAAHAQQSFPQTHLNDVALRESTLFAEVNTLSQMSKAWGRLANTIAGRLTPQSVPKSTNG